MAERGIRRLRLIAALTFAGVTGMAGSTLPSVIASDDTPPIVTMWIHCSAGTIHAEDCMATLNCVDCSQFADSSRLTAGQSTGVGRVP